MKVTLQFRGREVAHPELGRKILDDVILALGPTAKVENQARMEGRNMTLVLAPDKKAQDALRKAAEAERKEAAATAAPEQDSEVNEDHDPVGAATADTAGTADLAEASVESEPATPQTVGDE